jgi:hypothetical protein
LVLCSGLTFIGHGSWQPDFSSRQYSEALVEWIVDKVNNENNFLKKTRHRFREMGVKAKKPK